MFSRFDRISACDGQTNRQQGPRYAYNRAVRMVYTTWLKIKQYLLFILHLRAKLVWQDI